ncbi:MAG: sugar ABC transporter substrate-binding protein [Anaerolineaceae bacterium]|nr:sugar ABC transporter substrate-binding protein [Anaerolineaceae bacterium]
MKFHKIYPLFGLLVIISMMMASCQPAAQPQAEIVVQTQIVEKNVEVTGMPEAEPEISDEDVVTITWWGTEKGRDTAETREMHYQLARAFEETHPNTKVAVSLFPSRGFATRVLTAIAAGQGPDVWYHYWSPDIASQGFLEDLTPYMENDGLNPEELWFPIGAIRGEYEGKYYAVPRDATGYVFLYNKDIFDGAGVEYPQEGWTSADLREKAIAVTDAGNNIYGLSTIDSGWFQWHPFSFNLGADFVSLDGKTVSGYMDTPEAINAMKYVLDLAATDKVSAPAGLADQFGLDFLSGQIGMFGMTTWEVPLFLEQVDFEYGVIAPPAFEDGVEEIPWTDSYMFYMNSDSAYKSRVWDFMKFLSGYDGGVLMAEAGIWTPAIPQIWEEMGWLEDPILGPIYAELEKPARVLNYERSQFYWDCVGGIFDTVTTGYIDEGNTDLESIVPPLVVDAQECLDKNNAGLSQ